MAAPDKVTKLKNVCRTERGHFTRLREALLRAADFARQNDDSHSTAELIAVFDKFRKKTDTVLDILGELQTEDAAAYATYEANIKDTDKDYQKTRCSKALHFAT